MFRLIAAACLWLSLPSAAEAIEGLYRVFGRSPDRSGTYSGEAVIRRSGSVYHVVWQTTLGRHVGTGILSGPVLSVVFRDRAERETPGVASYLIIDGLVSEGSWATLGQGLVGTEVWTLAPAQ